MSAGMLAYANACHCGQSTRSVCIYALVECTRCARARIDILPVFGISILFLWEYSCLYWYIACVVLCISPESLKHLETHENYCEQV